MDNMKVDKKVPEDKGDGAAFNQGILITKRLDELFRDCAYAARIGNLENWFNALLCLERECSSEFQDDDEERVSSYRQKVVSFLEEHNKNSTNPQTKNRVFNALHNYEVELRRVQKVRGLGMPTKKSDLDALGA